jgi:biopolymer transport protein ExbB/TolQ
MKNVSKIDKEPDDLWKEEEKNITILHKNLYEKYEKSHQCGQLANIGISTPFVGLFGSVVVISELLRALNQGRCYSIVSLQMRDLTSIETVECGYYNKDLLRFAI